MNEVDRQLDALIYNTVIHSKANWIADRDGMFGVPRYSTDISDAWLVVEKLESMGKVVIITTAKNMPALVGIRYVMDGIEQVDYSEGETVPEAICKVALKHMKLNL